MNAIKREIDEGLVALNAEEVPRTAYEGWSEIRVLVSDDTKQDLSSENPFFRVNIEVIDNILVNSSL